MDNSNENPYIGYYMRKRSTDKSILTEIWEGSNSNNEHPTNQWKLISSWCDLPIKTDIKKEKQDTNEKK